MRIPVYFKTGSFVAKIAAAVLKAGRCAIVFRRTIHLHNISVAEIKADKPFLCHELTHVLQWKKYGLVRFPLLYLWYSLKYGYYQNPFEIEARANAGNISILDQFVLK